LANSPDLKSARSFAEQLGIPLRIRKLTSSDVEKLIPKVIRAVEERDFNQVETSIALYAVVEMARKDGIRVLLNGQGPDELWGGYVWYPKLLEEVGYDRLHEQLWEDFSMADVETLERENKVAKTLDVQIRYPYLNLRVIRTAMSIAPSLKVQSGTDPLGKHVHRELAEKLGVPKAYAERPKEAFQHGAGIHTVLDQIAQKNGFNEKLSRSIGYSSDKISKEKLGSSTRYGYKYSQKGSWLVPDHVQLYLDTVAYENNLLNKDEREKIEKFLEICQDRGRVVSRTTGK
jgi:asparagine synthase (glutamine-hydrolysing)